MNEGLRGVIVCHSSLATGLVSAVEEISGIRDALIPVTNSGCNREALENQIEAAIGTEPAIVFVDLPTGSCLMAALHRLHGRRGIPIVTGVNLAMLLDFVFHRELPADQAVTRALKAGADAIRIP